VVTISDNTPDNTCTFLPPILSTEGTHFLTNRTRTLLHGIGNEVSEGNEVSASSQTEIFTEKGTTTISITTGTTNNQRTKYCYYYYYYYHYYYYYYYLSLLVSAPSSPSMHPPHQKIIALQTDTA
jgi:hypothetical protein